MSSSVTSSPAPALRWAAALAAVVGASTWFVTNVDSADLWWHLASGRVFFERGSVPHVDPLSFTADQPWVNHEWLWGVAAFALYRIDPQLLAWGNFALLALAFYLAFDSAYHQSRAPVASVLATWLAAASAHWFFDLRPQLVTLLGAVVVLATRRLRLAPWLWPPLLLVWCNMHAGYLFGLGAVGLLVLSHALYARLAPGSAPAELFASWGKKAPFVGLLLAIAVLAVNPWGGALLDFATSYAPGSGRTVYADEIVEWQPFGWDAAALRVLGPLGFLGTFRGRYLLVVALALPSCVKLLRRDAYPVMLFSVSFAMAMLARRFVELSSVLAAPLCACTLASAGRWLGARLSLDRRPLLRTLPAVGLACGLALIVVDARVLPDLFARWSRPDMHPRAAVRYLAALRTPVRVFNYEVWGGYLMFHAPHTRVFFDGRASTVYSEKVYRDYLQLMNGREPIAPLVREYRLDAVLVPRSHLVDVLLAAPLSWKIAYEDDSALLLLPPDSPCWARPLPKPEEVLAKEPSWLRRQAALALRAGKGELAVATLQRALVQDPFFVPAYTDLMALLAASAPMPMVEAVADGARALLPHRATDFALHLGMAYERRGDIPSAVRAYRKAISGGPLVSEQSLLSGVERLSRK